MTTQTWKFDTVRHRVVSKVHGDLTMHGVTRPMVLEAEYLGVAKDPWGNRKAGFSAKGSLERKDFGLNWNQLLEAGGVLIAEKLELEAVATMATRAA